MKIYTSCAATPAADDCSNQSINSSSSYQKNKIKSIAPDSHNCPGYREDRLLIQQLKLEFWSIGLGLDNLQMNSHRLENTVWNATIHFSNLLLLLIYIPFSTSLLTSRGQVHRPFYAKPARERQRKSLLISLSNNWLHYIRLNIQMKSMEVALYGTTDL